MNTKKTRVIIALYGASDRGKTQSIKHFARRAGVLIDLEGNLIPVDPTNSVDIFGIITQGNFRIGIASQGDPGSGLEDRLAQLAKQNCQIIVTCCRTWGASMDEIRRTEENFHYRTIWFTNFNSGDFFDAHEMNRLSGVAIGNAVQSVMDGEIFSRKPSL